MGPLSSLGNHLSAPHHAAFISGAGVLVDGGLTAGQLLPPGKS